MKLFKLFIPVLMLMFCIPALADNDRIITFEQLPKTAQAFLTEHFADKTPAIVKVDNDDYTVIYNSGEEVEFTKRGEWKSVDCRMTAVPDVLVPQEIKTQVDGRYPGSLITKISKDRKGYEIELSNGLDIEFNRNFVIVDIDD